MVILPNPPVEDAAGGEADKSPRLPCGCEAYSSGVMLKN